MTKFSFPFSLCCFVFVLANVFAVAKSAQRHYISKQLTKAEKPSVKKEFYGEIAGQNYIPVHAKNSNGMVVKVISYGCTITDVITPDKNKEMGSVVLGFDSLSSYTGRTNSLLGATVGRVANRIANKKFTLDGKEYTLTSNIHGGQRGFDKRIWDVKEVPGNEEAALKMTYLSKDGEEGFPGNLKVTITYTLTDHNELRLNYDATTDKATPVVLTNHTYFNLSGGKDAKALNTELNILADRFLEAAPGPGALS